MDRSRVLKLISNTYIKDSIKQQVPQETAREVFCNVTGISGTEKLEAGREGLNPQFRATVFAFDYNGEEIVELDGERYSVYRTYPGKNEDMELYLEKKVGI